MEEGSKEQPFLLTSLGAGSEPPSRAAPQAADLHLHTVWFSFSLWFCILLFLLGLVETIHFESDSLPREVKGSLSVNSSGPLGGGKGSLVPCSCVLQACLTFPWCHFNHVTSKCFLCPCRDKNSNNGIHLLKHLGRKKKKAKEFTSQQLELWMLTEELSKAC